MTIATMNLKSQLSQLGNDYECILNEAYAEAYYFSDTKTMYLYWKKMTSFEEYKKVFICLLDFNDEKPSDFFLSDIRKQGTSNPEKKDWFKQYALKRATASGLKKGAVIVDSNPFKQFYINIILAATNTMGLPFKTVSEVEGARTWFEA